MTTLLAIETSGAVCSVALHSRGVMFQQRHSEPRTHSAHIHELIRAVLTEGGVSLSAVEVMAVTTGPGSFTGIRLGLSVVQGLAYGCNVPVVPISSLAAVAAYGLAQQQGPLLIGLDARMGQIYWAVYEYCQQYGVQARYPDVLADPGNIILPAACYTSAIGPGWPAYYSELASSITSAVDDEAHQYIPYAQYVAELALLRLTQAVNPENIRAQYLRNQVAHTKNAP